ncbi:cubilin-like [Branchiostoma lanceolatum]|uniref:cubilin-like n=1 Tax=Branchiostoma lanceolatum TaxID=7740 RepID=UPI003453D6A2
MSAVFVPTITSTSTQMFVRFTSDESVTAQGFQFSYMAKTAIAISSARCGGSLTAPPKGYVKSPNYPMAYGNNENCEWTITVPEGNTVSLTVDRFNVEDGADFLNIYDGDSDSRILLRSYTGEESADTITSISNYMYVRFISDDVTTGQGFLFSYTANTATPISTARCGGSLTAPPKGYVTSPNYPMNYRDNESCEWTITVPEGSTVRLTFHNFQLENADSLTIYDKDGDSATQLQSYTGVESVYPITSTSNEMIVRFTSGPSYTAKGFIYSYTATPTNGTGCGGNLTAPPEGIVTSPNYPNDYGNEENCDWTITVPEGNIVRLTFDSFVTEVDFDFLFVYDGDSDTAAPLQRLTGDMSDVHVPTITSTSTQMFVRFTSDESVTAQGFQFSYMESARCGGSLTAPPEGYVTSPNYPMDYGNNETCEWTITVPEGYTVRLTFHSFRLENADSLTIYDKDAYTGPRPSICGRSLTAPPRGYVTSPNYPNKYGNNENCGWTITVPEGSTVSLTVESLNIENCCDFLDIYDGDSSSRIWLRSLTGEVSVDPINSTSNQMFLRFSSDESVTAQGFQFNYRATPTSGTGCGGNLTAPPVGNVTSPNYPNDYGNEENCDWTITVPEGNIVRLTFDSFVTEVDFDFLFVYDGDSDTAAPLQRLTGGMSAVHVPPITSTSSQMFVRFTSDESVTAQGFQFSYIAIPTSATGCGGNLMAPPVGIVKSPNYPDDYDNEENCDWTITVPEGNIVRLTFDSFVTEADFDFLFVYDGDSDTAALLQRLTGNMSAVYVPTITSTSTQMFVRLTSDESVTAQGFQFSYIATPTSGTGCGGNLTAPPVGIVTSPNYPNDYGNKENCNWTITVPEGNIVRLTFDSFITERNYDILFAYDGDSDNAAQLPRLTGDMSAVYVPTIISTSTQMFVRFTSDKSVTAQGFQFSYIVNVTSPNYPEHYDNDQTCELTITVPEGKYVHLTFNSFNLEDGYDFMNIYDGGSDSATQSHRLTGELSVYSIIGTSHEMFVRFTSDGWGTRQGFQFTVAEAYSPRCGGNLAVPPEGTVSYPGHYSSYATCEWTITAPDGSYVRLTFANFHVKDTDDSLTIYDGNSGRATQLKSLTGDMSVYPVTSTSNQMFVRLKKSNYTEDDDRPEFQFTVTEISALGCGGTLTAPPKGNVTSPNYPNNYGNDQTCEWTIAVPEGTYIHLTFSSFNLDEGNDFLTIYKRDGDSASLVQSGTAQGFLFSYTVTLTRAPGCGGLLTASPGDTVASTNYPGHYGNDETCEWTIIVPKGRYVHLTFGSFNLEVGYDFLTIHDGLSDGSTLLQRLTGEESVDPITSSSNLMFLRFESDESETRQGFQFTYTVIATSAPGCGGNLTVPPEGTVTSPGYPSNYGNDQACEWTITAPEGSRVRLTFASFHLDDDYDFLIVKDGGSGRATQLQR